MNKVDFLILGGGIAGTTAAEEIRAQDKISSITIITEESNRLYSRVRLPHFLRNENTFENLYVRTAESYSQKNLQLLTNLKVTKVDTVNKIVHTATDQVFNYGKLLIATGGKVNKLEIPGANLDGVVYLRTIENAKQIKEKMAGSQEAVVFGGGFIGIELAQSFVKNNLKTTLVIAEKTFWESVVGENQGKLLSTIISDNGVTILTQESMVQFLGKDKLETVKLSNGSEIKANIAGIGIGIHLDIDYLKESGLTLNKGVVTNEFLETSVPGVWAAGDVAEFYDPVLKRYHSLGNWSNASNQGRTVGLNIAGGKNIFETASLYSINIFDNNFSFLGDGLIDDNTEIVERGTLEERKIARLLLRNDVIVGASLINLPVERATIIKLIKDRVKITAAKAKLTDLSFDITSLLNS